MDKCALPPILTPSLILRCFVPEDAPKAYAMSREAGMLGWLPDQVYENEGHALEVLRRLIEAYRDPGTPVRGPYVLGVCARGSQEIVGHVGLSPLGGEVEIGYAIEEGHQGRGLASEAVAAMSEWGLARFLLPRVLGIVAVDNPASCRVLQKAGFEFADESLRALHGRSRLVRTYQRVAGARDR